MKALHLARGRTRATLLPGAGGRLHALDILLERWTPLLVAPAAAADAPRAPTQSGSFAMAPWPNRIAGARFAFGGRTHALEANHGAHAIHGLGAFRPWSVESSSAEACALWCSLEGAWPFGGRLVQRIAVHDDGIEQTVEVHAGREPFPAGAGWHPWFRRDVRPGAEPHVRIDADETYELRDMIPTGALRRVTGDTDLRDGPALGARRLDECYRAVRGPLTVRWGDVELRMQSSPNVTHAVAYTPEHAFCVEPQTCAIDAFNLAARGVDAGVIVVEPGRPLIASTAWRWRAG